MVLGPGCRDNTISGGKLTCPQKTSRASDSRQSRKAPVPSTPKLLPQPLLHPFSQHLYGRRHGAVASEARLLDLNPPCVTLGFPGGVSGKEPACQCRRLKRCRFNPRVGKIPLEEGMATHSSVLA